MSSLFAFLESPRFLQLLMVAILCEAAVLIAYHSRTGRGPRPWTVCTFLGAGLSFVIALYAVRALTDPSVVFIIALTSALVFHIWHLALISRR